MKRSRYFTPLEEKIYDVLKKLAHMIQSGSTELDSAKKELRILNEKYMGVISMECAGTSILQALMDFETAELNQKERQEYNSDVFHVWNLYVKRNFFPYLAGPVHILTTKHIENDDQELSAIMLFVKYQWDELYGKCQFNEDHYNVIGFLSGRNECNCTCISAILLMTADCLGLFPEFILAQQTWEHIFVITHRGLAIEGTLPIKSMMRGNKPRAPTSYAIRTAKDFIESVGWYTEHKHYKDSGEYDRPEFVAAMLSETENPTISGRNFAIKYIKKFSELKVFERRHMNARFTAFYYEYLLLLHEYRSSHMLEQVGIPTIGNNQFDDMIRFPRYRHRKYRMLVLLTIMYLNLDKTYYHYNYDRTGPKLTAGVIKLFSKHASDVNRYTEQICDEFTSDDSTFDSPMMTSTEIFKTAAYDNFKVIIELWRTIIELSKKSTDSDVTIPTYYIVNLKKLINTCFTS